jgi:ParB-like chromosome segregation protein Spo0J
VVIEGPEGPQTAVPNAALQKAVARAHYWNERLVEGETLSIRAVARAEGLSARYVRRILPLAFLAPDIIDAILDGTQSPSLSVAGLSNELPLDWDEQRKRYGFQG